MMEKLFTNPFLKIKIKHISGLTVRNFVCLIIHFVFIVYPSRRLPRYIETKALALTFISFKVFSKKAK